MLAEVREDRRSSWPGRSSRDTNADLSFQWSFDSWVLQGGRRFLPIASEFLAMPGDRSHLDGVPSRRSRPSAFLGLREEHAWATFVPGLFAIENHWGPFYRPLPGVFVLWQPGTERAAFVLRGRREIDERVRVSWLVDVNRSSRDGLPDGSACGHPIRCSPLWQGYGELRVHEQGRPILRLVALRENSWDLEVGPTTIVERRGRSGAAAAVGRPFRFLTFEGAGLQRLGESFRMGGLFVGDSFATGFAFGLRGRFYRYESLEGREKEVPAKHEDRSAGPALTWRSRHETIHLFAEGRERGEPTAQLEVRHRRGGLTLAGSLLVRRAARQPEVLYTETGSFRDGGPLFYTNRERVLRLEARGENLAFLLSTALGSGRPERFGRLQWRWHLNATSGNAGSAR